MQIEELRAIYDQDQRIDVRYPDTERECVNGVIVRHLQTTGRKLGWILWSQLKSDTIDAIIDEQLAYFKHIGREFEWKVFSYDEPVDLKDRLVDRGFDLREPADAIMVLDMQNLPAVFTRPVPKNIRRISDPADIPAAMVVLAQVWNEDFSPLGAELANQMQHTPDALSLYVAYVDDQVVSTAWSQFALNSAFVSLWGGTTLPEYRKQGFYSGLLAARAAEAQARGRRFLTVDASPMSRPILEKFGFVNIAMATACIWRPSDT